MQSWPDYSTYKHNKEMLIYIFTKLHSRITLTYNIFHLLFLQYLLTEEYFLLILIFFGLI